MVRGNPSEQTEGDGGAQGGIIISNLEKRERDDGARGAFPEITSAPPSLDGWWVLKMEAC